MIRHIPPKETRRWTGPYLGNYYGTLWKTFNVDLDRNEGKIGLSQRFQRIEDSSETLSLNGSIRTFIRTNADCTDRYWALHPAGLLKTDSAQPEESLVPSTDWDTDAIASSPSSNNWDMAVIGNDSRADSGKNKLFVTRDSFAINGDISVLNDTGNNAWTGSWWITKQAQPALRVTDYGSPIEYFPFRKIGLVGDGNLVHTISRPSDTQNDTVTYARLTLPASLFIFHIFTTTNRAWFLCRHTLNGEGAIVEWDGFSQTYNEIHKAYSIAALSGVNYRETPIVLNSKGSILEYNGKGFVPMVRQGQKVALPCNEEIGNGLSVLSNDSDFYPLVHRRGMVVGEDELIYLNVRHPSSPSFRQGAGVWCLNPISGRLYNKYSLGRYTDSGTAFDFGTQRMFAVTHGALYSIPSHVSDRNLLVGGRVLTSATLNQSGIWLLEAPTSVTVNRGYFITQYIASDEVKDFWDTIWVRFRRFISSNSIVVKARGSRPMVLANGDPVEATITYTSTTTFTVTLATNDDALQIGDEVEGVAGGGAGYLSHITTISGTHAALQTITIDETMPVSSGTAIARFDRWKKLGTITSTSTQEQFVNIGIDSSFIQFKVEMRGPVREMEISDLIVKSKPSINV